MFVDAHCHLNMMVNKKQDVPLIESDYKIIEDIFFQAAKEGVEKIVNVGTSVPECLNSIALARRITGVYATVGIHPCDCRDLNGTAVTDALGSIKKMCLDKEANKIVAIGEIGLDFYHKPYSQQQQEYFFKTQLEMALEYNLPVVIHTRDSIDETLKIIQQYVGSGVRGTFHCFSQSEDIAKIILDWGFYIGLNGPITYPKNESMRQMFKNIPLERILLETDSPFLPPQQFRGQQNSPKYIPIIAQALAQIQGKDLVCVRDVTTKNAIDLFNKLGED